MAEPTGAAVPRLPMPVPPGVVYYGSRDVVVTDQIFVCAGRQIALNRLVNVHTLRAPVSPLGINGVIAAAAVALVLVVAGGTLDTAGRVGGLVVLAVPATVAAAGLARRRSYELWADVTGPTGDRESNLTRVLLLRIDDAERYHQICRAIVRAQQHGRS